MPPRYVSVNASSVRDTNNYIVSPKRAVPVNMSWWSDRQWSNLNWPKRARIGQFSCARDRIAYLFGDLKMFH